MPSSISNSNPRSANAFIALLLALLVLLGVCVELGSRLLVNPASKVQRRVESERAAALTLRRGLVVGGPRTLLLAGNSLLLEGVDMPALQAQLLPQWRVHRFVMDDTGYLDWYFGLRRIFNEGSQPDAVLLMLSPGNFSTGRTRGDYFAHYLMRPSDLPAVLKSTHTHPTVGSGYLLARYSVFYALRIEFRKQVSLRVFPGVEKMLRMLVQNSGTDGAGMAANRSDLLRQRAAELAELSRTYSTPVIIAFPPSGTSPALAQDEHVALDALASAGRLGLLPLPSAETQPGQYSDGFHLNESGRAAFTAKLAQAILGVQDRIVDRPM